MQPFVTPGRLPNMVGVQAGTVDVIQERETAARKAGSPKAEKAV